MQQLAKINEKEIKKQMLRVAVDSGGCHGFQYKIELSDTLNKDDMYFLNDCSVFEKQGEKFLVDEMSLDFLKGSTLDFVEELIGASFQIVNNPNAETSCGCKTSFNLKV